LSGIRFQADADLNQAIVTGTKQREPSIDFQSAVEAGLKGIPDPEILERADRQQRILVTHDRSSMPNHLRARLEAGQSSPGILIVSQFGPIGPIVEVLILMWAASLPDEWRDQAYYLPSLTRHPLRPGK
jgi:hypothetical protein